MDQRWAANSGMQSPGASQCPGLGLLLDQMGAKGTQQTSRPCCKGLRPLDRAPPAELASLEAVAWGWVPVASSSRSFVLTLNPASEGHISKFCNDFRIGGG